jgi:hypothetical protein
MARSPMRHLLIARPSRAGSPRARDQAWTGRRRPPKCGRSDPDMVGMTAYRWLAMSGAARCHYRRTKADDAPLESTGGARVGASRCSVSSLRRLRANGSSSPELRLPKHRPSPHCGRKTGREPALNATALDRTPLRPLTDIPSSRLDGECPRRRRRRSEVRRAAVTSEDRRSCECVGHGRARCCERSFPVCPRIRRDAVHEGAASSARESTTMSAHSAVDLPIEIGYP